MAEQDNRFSLQSKLRLGFVFLFLPLLVLAAVYYYHFKQEVSEQLHQQLENDTRTFEQNFVSPYLERLMHQFNTLYTTFVTNNGAQDLSQITPHRQDWELLSTLRGDVQLLYFANQAEQVVSYPSFSALPPDALSCSSSGRSSFVACFSSRIFSTLANMESLVAWPGIVRTRK